MSKSVRAQVVCTLTGHELPPNVHAINAYLSTKGYAKAMHLQRILDEHAAFLVDDEYGLAFTLGPKVL